MNKLILLGCMFLLMWVAFIMFDIPEQDNLLLLSVIVGGSISLPLYFGIVYLLKGTPRRKWIAWLFIILSPILISPLIIYFVVRFITIR